MQHLFCPHVVHPRIGMARVVTACSLPHRFIGELQPKRVGEGVIMASTGSMAVPSVLLSIVHSNCGHTIQQSGNAKRQYNPRGH